MSNKGRLMIFETIVSGGCRSYLYGCEESCASVLIDPSLDKLDQYARLVGQHGLRVDYVIETHTHADHFSAANKLAAHFRAPIVMHEFKTTIKKTKIILERKK